MKSRVYPRYFAAKSSEENKIEFQLIQSIYQNDEGTFETLIDAIGSIDAVIGTGRGKWTTLMFAVHKKRDNMVEKLLKMGANPNCMDHSTKKSCLHAACTSGYAKIVRLLLETGKVENINYNDNTEGLSPIYSAVRKSRKFCVELLLNHILHSQICDINVSSKTNGQSPLFIACDKGDAEIVKLLINYKYMKCDVNAMDNKGYTPLMKAVAKNHIKVIQLLLNKQQNPLGIPNINLVNNWKQCATMLAVRANNTKISKILLNQDENDGVLYRVDWKDRNILDQCKKYRTDKKITGYIKKLLYTNIHSVIHSINTSKVHENVPYLPSDVVQYICNMTY